MDVSWSLGVTDATGLSLYRDGDLIATPSTETQSIEDAELDPNTRYVYKLVVSRPNDAEVADEKGVATLAYPPRISTQMATHWTGFQQPIIDELNPDYTEYRVFLTRHGSLTPVMDVADTDWGTSKCRKIDGLEPKQFYEISVTARNLDGIETEPANLIRGSPFDNALVSTRVHAANEDPWAKDRVRDVVRIYGLTEAAEEWMNSDIHIGWERGEPGYAGAQWGKPTVGHSYPGTLMHEAMHVFWQFWDGFPEPCDRMNFYTFRRDVAQFVIDFRDYYHSDFSEDFDWESWRLYYDMMLGLLEEAPPDNEDFWEILERREYIKLWWGFFHIMETNIPLQAPRSLSLFPPTVQKYFQGFMKPGEEITWEEQIFWYSRLAEEDQVLAHPFTSHAITHHTIESIADPGHPRTRLPEPLRTHLREANRQMLVDFINTLEDISPWEWREQSPWFWRYYVRWHLYRASLYGSELSPEVGIEMDAANLEAVLTALQALYDYHCLPKETPNCGYDRHSLSLTRRDAAHETITNLDALTDKQRRVLLEMILLERG